MPRVGRRLAGLLLIVLCLSLMAFRTGWDASPGSNGSNCSVCLALMAFRAGWDGYRWEGHGAGGSNPGTGAAFAVEAAPSGSAVIGAGGQEGAPAAVAASAVVGDATGGAPSSSDVAPGAAATDLAQTLAQLLAPVRVPRPEVPTGPRRVGLQAGHWQTDQVPEELRRLEHSTGAFWNGVPEWRVNLDIANRTATILRGHGYQVDVLPTTVPAGYLADAFVALHADGDLNGSARGFKAAHGSRRGPYEDRLVRALVEEYGRSTNLPVDAKVTRNMLGYYAFSWSRYQSTVAPHTPAAILELGFLTSAADRTLLVGNPDLVAHAVARGILRFLDEVPAGAAFADDIIVPPFARFQPTPAASAASTVGQ